METDAGFEKFKSVDSIESKKLNIDDQLIIKYQCFDETGSEIDTKELKLNVVNKNADGKVMLTEESFKYDEYFLLNGDWAVGKDFFENVKVKKREEAPKTNTRITNIQINAVDIEAWEAMGTNWLVNQISKLKSSLKTEMKYKKKFINMATERSEEKIAIKDVHNKKELLLYSELINNGNKINKCLLVLVLVNIFCPCLINIIPEMQSAILLSDSILSILLIALIFCLSEKNVNDFEKIFYEKEKNKFFIICN